ncbi:VOC family protein [Aeromicrobium sp. CF4.19]|uniref:VOC family protein n=1 Tax=Aeromicrobium sp. CF4.19 TaxID=3373082 RepID=UPI003EE7115A
MALVAYKDLCIDVNDMASTTAFWGQALGLDVVPDDDGSGEVHLEGPTPRHMVLPCIVPEPKTVKNRVHLDVRARSVEDLPGATRLSDTGEFPWAVLADAEGNELCVFTYDEVPDYRLKDVVVDAADHAALASWWAEVWGGTVTHAEEGYSHLDGVPGVPFESFDFVPVPEPKTVKNRVHWDVHLLGDATVDDLVSAGATVLRPQDDEIGWTVMADPEGNEFCVFARRDA